MKFRGHKGNKSENLSSTTHQPELTSSVFIASFVWKRLVLLFLFVSVLSLITFMIYYSQHFSDHSTGEMSDLISKVEYYPITSAYMDSLRKLNQVLLPITYSDHMYRRVNENPRFCRIALLNGKIPIGSITSRLEDPIITGISFVRSSTLTSEKHIYIMTIGVLPLYRRFGIGTRLLEEIAKEAIRTNSDNASGKSITLYTALTLHVQYNNTAAMEFYERNGFRIYKDIPNYYSTVQPTGAYLLLKELR